jgi:hypothetical protein
MAPVKAVPIVVVYPIQGYVGLVAARAIHGARAAVGRTGDMSAVAGKDDSSLQTENAGRVAAFEGKVGNLIGAEGVAHGRVQRVHERGRAGDIYSDGSASNLHVDVQGGRGGNLEFQATLPHRGEASGVHGHIVFRGRQLEELVVALTVTLTGALEPCGRVRDYDRRTGNHCALGVVHGAVQGSGCALREQHGTESEDTSDPSDRHPSNRNTEARTHGEFLHPRDVTSKLLPRKIERTRDPWGLMADYCATLLPQCASLIFNAFGAVKRFNTGFHIRRSRY